MSEQQFIEDTEIEAANENVEIPKKKKEFSNPVFFFSFFILIILSTGIAFH
jgi:hypothetical protein